LRDYWSNEKSPVSENPSYAEGAMEIVFWVIVATVALVIAYLCALSVAKRRRYRSDRPAAAPDPKEHGVDQARRKLHDDVT
jgi:formate-dependent nitrite reductase membrane component NrfD